jgi:hypothetical protein
MKNTLALILVLFVDPVSADQGVDITEPDRVAALGAIQLQLDAISDGVMSCMGSGEAHPVCLCRHREAIVRFNAGVKDLDINYPDLSTLDIIRFREASGSWVSQSLDGLRRQSGNTPSCP